MAYNEKLTNRVREILEDLPRVEEKRMFVGVVFMVDDKMCISVGDDRLMVRIDPALHESAVEKEGCREVTMRGRVYKGFVYVQEEVVNTRKKLQYWTDLALDYNKRVKVRPKKAKKKAARKKVAKKKTTRKKK